ncbi:MAG: type II secretion system protein GspD [Phycisphaerales bacterium JB039]
MATQWLRDRATRKTFGLAVALAMLAGAPAGVAQDDPFKLGSQGGQIMSSGQQEGGELRDPLDPDPLNLDGTVTVNEHNIVDLHVADEDLANVLQMLSLQTQKNIITSQSVNATITATLYGVTFYEALDAILHVNGYGYIEEGNFIYVYTVEELIEIEKANRKRVSQVIHLDYLNAVDAAEFATPFLSDTGQIKTPGATEDFNIPGNGPVGADDYALASMIVVIDFEENVAQVTSLIDEIDTRPSQVLVEATILQSQVTEANAFGVDFSILGSLDFDEFTSGLGGPLEAVDALLNGAGESAGGSGEVPMPGDGFGHAYTSTPGNTKGPATFKAGVVSGDFAVFLRMLDEVTDTVVLSRPKLLTLNRQPARVLVGRKVGYLSTTTTDTSSTQTVEFLDTGTQLYLRPFVSQDGMIRMELKPQVSEAVIRTSTDSTGGTVTIPDEITNEIVANVMVRDGQTIVLGGLFRESTQATRRQVPFLGDIPVIGAAFRGNDDTTDRQEIIFMITPTIVNDQILIEQAERGMEFIDHARTGAREGLLPWSREKRSSQLLVDARRLADEGKVKQAAYAVRRSLGLNPFQPDAYEMLESLTGESKQWPDRSLLEEIINHEVETEMESVMGRSDDEHVVSRQLRAAQADAMTSQTTGSAQSASAQGQGRAAPTAAPATPTAAPTPEAGVVTEVPDQPEEFEGADAGELEAPGAVPFSVAAAPVEDSSSTPEFVDDGADPTDAAAHASGRSFARAPQVASAAGAATGLGAIAGSELGEAAAAAPATPPAPKTLDLVYNRKPLKDVMADVGVKFRRNIVVPPDANEPITATLYGVEFEDALAAILESSGYRYTQEGALVRVSRVETFEAPPTVVAGQPEAAAAPDASAATGAGFGDAAFSKQEEALEAQLAASAVLRNLSWLEPATLVTPRSAREGASESFRKPADWTDDPAAAPSKPAAKPMDEVGAAPSPEPTLV